MSLSLLVLLGVLVAGILAYALATNPKVAELGRIAFFAALLVILLLFGEGRLR